MSVETVPQPVDNDPEAAVIQLVEDGWVDRAVRSMAITRGVLEADEPDIAQDFAIRMLKHPEFAHEAGYQGGFMMIGQIITDRWRRSQTRPQYDSVASSKLNNPHETPYSSLDIIPDFSADADRRIVVERMLSQLSCEQRSVVECFYMLGMDSPQTAAALGIPEGTVKSRLNYSRLVMRRLLAKQGFNSYDELP